MAMPWFITWVIARTVSTSTKTQELLKNIKKNTTGVTVLCLQNSISSTVFLYRADKVVVRVSELFVHYYYKKVHLQSKWTIGPFRRQVEKLIMIIRVMSASF